MKPQISKSQYMYGKQCLLRLWYYRNRKDLQKDVDSTTQAILDQGHQVGELAMQYFPNGVEVTASPYELEEAREQTEAFINEEKQAIYEAYACSKDGVYFRIDILKKVEDKDEWDMIEVKSSTSVKEQFIDDMAVQRYAFEGAGYKIRKSGLMYINNKYVRQGPIDVKKLFKIEYCTNTVVERMSEIRSNLESFIQILNQENEPLIKVGIHCKYPYPCPYIEHCNADAPKDDVVDDKLLINRRLLRDFVDKLEYPLYFLDYETINMAIPPFDGMSPYKQYTFQYSLHIQQEKDGEVVHKEYLHSQPSDPREELIINLIRDCEKSGSVIVYNKSFEASRNKELAKDFPKYASDLIAINNRMIDLAVPFRRKGLAYSSWGRQYSIKIVLPAFVPELSYKNLAIQGGGDACHIYTGIILGLVDREDKNKILNDLKEYCGLDTLAMVKLLEVIYAKVDPIY